MAALWLLLAGVVSASVGVTALGVARARGRRRTPRAKLSGPHCLLCRTLDEEAAVGIVPVDFELWTMELETKE